MSYATVADLLARFGAAELEQLTDINKPRLMAVDEVVALQAIDDASALIDGYLIGRYTLPLLPAPAVLTVHCCGLARYQLMRRSPDERATNDYEGAVKFLTAVSKGDIALLPPSAAPAVAGLGPVLFSQGSKIMGRESY
jgi:phage gp36-like protein